MTLEKAIEQLSRGTLQNRSTANKLLREAMRLGIEAMRRILFLRGYSMTQVDTKLPGETEPEPQPTRDEVKRYMDERKGETEE